MVEFDLEVEIAARRRKLLKYVGVLVETPSLYKHLSGTENLEVTRRWIWTGNTLTACCKS
jgi:ABC-type multidrug transport system ATPase subunit